MEVWTLRIISGSAKGRNIDTPKGNATRPTADRVKESIFSIIQARMPDSYILDLFAGSGSLGLEAISRGAKEAIFIEKEWTSFLTVKKNIHSLSFDSQCRVYQTDFQNALKQLHIQHEMFDIIFLDPPYLKGLLTIAIEEIVNKNLLNDNGIIIAEHMAQDMVFSKEGLYIVKDTRSYGNTAVSFIEKDVISR